MEKRCRLFLLLSLTAALAACDELFDVHPYDIDFNGEYRLNTPQIQAIEEQTLNKDTLRVAFISDTHGWLTDAEAEVASINSHPEIDFVIHCGDLTDTGTAKEFRWSRNILQKLKVPFVAMIGNHDFLGTGDQAYSVLYGDMDFSFIAARVKFVCLNTNATEYDYMAAVPNFDYMEQEIVSRSDSFDRTVIVMHAAPYSDQFNNNVCKAFRRYLDYFPGLQCCIFGHDHNNIVTDLFDDGLLFYSVDCAEHRNYRVMTLTPDGYEMDNIYF